ncbi:peptidase M48 family protein, partial [Vibrio parahaemolyticus V-223/04]
RDCGSVKEDWQQRSRLYLKHESQ